MRRELAITLLVVGVASASPSSASEPDDPASRARQYPEKCNAGDADACFNLGQVYANGEGVAQDKAKAAQLFRKACDAGSSSGCNNLGFAYDSGAGVAQDKVKAAELFKKTCDAGDAHGCSNLGSAYAYGVGTTQDKAKAAHLYQKACDGGVAVSCIILGDIYALGEGVAKDEARAAELFHKACDAGSATGCEGAKLLQRSRNDDRTNDSAGTTLSKVPTRWWLVILPVALLFGFAAYGLAWCLCLLLGKNLNLPPEPRAQMPGLIYLFVILLAFPMNYCIFRVQLAPGLSTNSWHGFDVGLWATLIAGIVVTAVFDWRWRRRG